jgi:hypothetical protein
MDVTIPSQEAATVIKRILGGTLVIRSRLPYLLGFAIAIAFPSLSEKKNRL